MNISKILFYFTALIELFIGVLILFYIWPVDVVKANVQPYKILTPIVKVGGSVSYMVDVCKFMKAQATVARTFVDDARYPSVISTNDIKVGCNKTKVTILVPNYIPPGTYHVELDVVYKVNPLRSTQYHFYTQNFEVIK